MVESEDTQRRLSLSESLAAHRDSIYRYVLSVVRDPPTAEDLTQETLLRAHLKLMRLDDDAKLVPWLYRIATNVCHDRFRQASYRHRPVPLEVDTESAHGEILAESVADGAPRLDKVMEQKEMSSCVQDFLARLSDPYRAVIPLIHIEKIGDSDPIPLPQGERPLSGLKVLSMVHAVAGPCVGRTLAMQGAECMNLNMPDWVEWGNFFFTAQAGQRQAYLDARKPENRKLVYKLVEEGDVFAENLRPGVADGEGYSPGALAERKPGIIYVSVKLNTHEGPWTNWPGYDFSAGGIAGLYTAEGTPDRPLPPQQVNVVCDIMTGYLGAIGAKAALLRRAREGGSYVVRVTLSQCVQYMTSLGFNDKRVIEDYENLGEEHQIMKPELVTGMTAFGEYTRPASQVEMSKTPQFWDQPMLYMQGASQPVWTTNAKGEPL